MTADKPAISTPVAILAGSIIIGLGLYFGLRSGRGEQPALGSASASPAGSASTAGQPDSTPRRRDTADTPVPVAAPSVVAQQAQAALDHYKPMLTDRCLHEPRATNAAPAEIRLSFNVTFGADGAQVARGLQEQRGYSDPSVTRCVGDLLPPLKIPPPGAITQVDISLVLR